jgi:hypothetical protein
LRLRNAHPALGASEATALDVSAPDDATIVMRRASDGERFLVVVRLEGAGTVEIADNGTTGPAAILSTEDPRYASDAAPIESRRSAGGISVTFSRPGAVILAVSQSA